MQSRFQRREFLRLCAQELWKNHPDLHQKMVQLQQQFVATEGAALS